VEEVDLEVVVQEVPDEVVEEVDENNQPSTRRNSSIKTQLK
jgi:hypothetical protein